MNSTSKAALLQSDEPLNTEPRRNWKEILLNRRMLVCIFLGFTSGMPLYVLIQLVPAWLRSHEVDLATIGLFSLMSLPYTWKFLWSPLMDRFSLPFLGRRRSWALITQIALFFAIGMLGQFDPAQSLTAIVAVSVHGVPVLGQPGHCDRRVPKRAAGGR
jgi:PAT family beta-lactamase induction signal transducer AmpG